MIKVIAITVWALLFGVPIYCLRHTRPENMLPDNYEIPVDNIARRARYEYKKIVLNKLPDARFQLEDFE